MSDHDEEIAEHDPPSIVAAAAGQMVTVEVGPDFERFLVHKELLVYHSEYFAAATRGPWKDTQDGVVPLHEVECTTFKLFVYWVYNRTVPKTYSLVEWSPIVGRAINVKDITKKWPRELLLVFIKAYAFGDRFLATKFRHYVSKKCCDQLCGTYLKLSNDWQVIEYAFNHVPLDRPILQHLADDYCTYWVENNDDEMDIQAQNRVPRSFLMRVNRRFAELRDMAKDEKYQRRCYYEHASDQDKQKCRDLHMVYNEKRDYGYFPIEV